MGDKVMKKEIKSIIKTVQEESTKETFINCHKSKPTDFTRNRKLQFKDVILFVIGLSNTSFDFEVDHFCKNADIDISPAALSKARNKVNYTAFLELLHITQSKLPIKNTFKGYRVIAVDGIKGDLPNTKELMEKYKPSKSSGYPQFHAVASFDVLNCNFIDAEFCPSPADERDLAYRLIERHNVKQDIFLFDRGFPSVALIQKLNNLGLKFVSRVSKSFLKEVNGFSSQKYKDKDLHINYIKRRGATSRVSNLELPYEFDLRCVKIELSSGDTELLITNLSKTEFNRQEIGKLYGMRWGIEVGFNHLKNAIHIEEFVGIKENSIKQEFYSILIKYNLLMQYTNEVEGTEFWSKKNYKIRL